MSDETPLDKDDYEEVRETAREFRAAADALNIIAMKMEDIVKDADTVEEYDRRINDVWDSLSDEETDALDKIA